MLAAVAATECVRVVVDRVAAETHCTLVEGNAAEALARRAKDLGRPAPRYKGNFLCAIDGYPESPECGDDPPNPYWSVWYFRDGKWIYSSLGVADLMVEDRDKDGHPDPLGFRFHDVDAKAPPRANPGYPKATPTRGAVPSRPSEPPRSVGPTSAVSRSPRASSAVATSAAAATAVTTTAAATPSDMASASDTGTPRPEATGVPEAGGAGSGFPVGTAAGAALAAGLIGAAALRFRRPS